MTDTLAPAVEALELPTELVEAAFAILSTHPMRVMLSDESLIATNDILRPPEVLLTWPRQLTKVMPSAPEQ